MALALITDTSNECLFEGEDISTGDISVTVPGYASIEVALRDSLNKSGENFEAAFSTDGKRPAKG